MSFAVYFAQQILRTARAELSHLKLQKLAFYCYGAARAQDELKERIVFEHWQHGPVSPEIYEAFKEHGSQAIPRPQGVEPVLQGAALDAFHIYSRLSAWQLREESHLEAPWVQAEDRGALDDEQIRAHFRQKFFSGRVQAPVHLPGAWSLALDGLPKLSGESLHELAQLLSQ